MSNLFDKFNYHSNVDEVEEAEGMNKMEEMEEMNNVKPTKKDRRKMSRSERAQDDYSALYLDIKLVEKQLELMKKREKELIVELQSPEPEKRTDRNHRLIQFASAFESKLKYKQETMNENGEIVEVEKSVKADSYLVKIILERLSADIESIVDEYNETNKRKEWNKAQNTKSSSRRVNLSNIKLSDEEKQAYADEAQKSMNKIIDEAKLKEAEKAEKAKM